MKHFFRSVFLLALILSTALTDGQAQKLKFPKIPIAREGGPDIRDAYENSLLINPATGQIPDNIREAELKYARRINRKTRKLQRREKASVWENRGPFNVGGRTRALAIDLENEDIILAAGVSGGLWRSTNAGANWTRVTNIDDIQSVTTIIQDPRPGFRNIWYYGTGERSGNSASASGAFFFGDGIFKSIDGGISWSQLDATTAPPEGFFSFFQFIWRLDIDPITGHLYVANAGGVYRSKDGGDSFELVLDGSNSTFTDLQISESGVLYASIDSRADINGGIWRSETGNSGEWTNIGDSFDDLPNDFRRVVIDINPGDEDVVYFLANASTNSAGVKSIDSGLGLNFIGLWRYEHNVGWENRSENLPGNEDDNDGEFVSPVGSFNAQGGYNLLVKVHPGDTSVLFIGGTNIYRSTDGFLSDSLRTWVGGYATINNISLYPNQHPDQHELVFYNSNPNRALSGHDGGLSRAENILQNEDDTSPVNWDNLNSGYLTTQSYAIAIDPKTGGSNQLLSGFQDNSTWFTDSSNPVAPWQDVFSGDGAYCAIADSGRILYVSAQFGNAFQYTLNEARDEVIGARSVDPPQVPNASPTLFINPFILDPNDDRIMYFLSFDRIFRSLDMTRANLNWQEMSNTVVNGGSRISALALSTNNPNNRLYYGTSNGRIFKLDNSISNSSSAEEITIEGQSGNVINISVDPFNADLVLVAFSNYGIRSIFRTEDGGETWEDISANLEENADGSGSGPSVRWLSIMGESYFAGTSTGLYRADATGAGALTWVPEGASEIGNTVVMMLQGRLADSTLYVGTHGNGVYSAQVEVPCSAVPSTGATSFRGEAISETEFGFAFDKGDGDTRIVLIKSGSNFTAADLPVDGVTYNANASFGEGDQIGDAFVISNGNPDSVVVTNLPENETYFVAIIEYSCGVSPNYLNSDTLTGQFATTCEGPTQNTQEVSISTNISDFLEISWGAGDGNARLVLVKEGGDAFTDQDLPVDGVTYAGDANFGDGDQIGNAFVISNSANRSSIFLLGTTPGNEYCATVVEYKCTSPIYKRDSLTTFCLVTTSLEDDLLSSALQVFPNPAQDEINISLDNSRFREAKAILYNQNGQVVLEKDLKAEGNELNSSLGLLDLGSGVYFLKIKTENAQSIQKVVIE